MSSAAKYSKVTRRLWGDKTFRSLRAPAPSPRELWLYLLTCPEQCAVPGIFRAFEGGVAGALGWSLEALRECFAEVSAKGLARADWEAGVVVLPKAFHHNQPESPNHVKGWRSAWDDIPECSLKSDYYHTIKALTEGLGETFSKAFNESLTEPCRYQEQEPEQDQDREGLGSRTSGPDLGSPEDSSKTSTSGASSSDRPSGLLQRQASSQDDDGCFGEAVRGWGRGVSSVTGRPFSVPRFGVELDKLIAALATHHPEVDGRDAWSADKGAEFARTGLALNVHKFVEWLNGGTGFGGAPSPGKAPPASEPRSPHRRPIEPLRPRPA